MVLDIPLSVSIWVPHWSILLFSKLKVTLWLTNINRKQFINQLITNSDWSWTNCVDISTVCLTQYRNKNTYVIFSNELYVKHKSLHNRKTLRANDLKLNCHHTIHPYLFKASWSGKPLMWNCSFPSFILLHICHLC